MREFWNNLSEREQLILKIGAGVLGLFILVQLIIAPVVGWRGEQARRADVARGVYDLVAEAAAQTGAGGAVASDRPIREAVTQTAAVADVTLSFVNARSDGALDVSATADPAKIFDWIARLQREHGVSVISSDIARDSGNPTLVRTQITFKAGG